MLHQPQPLASTSQLLSTPLAEDGIPGEVEDDLRVVGCMLIQEAGIMLKLPQSTMATAQVVFHRFFYVSSMLSFGVMDISISALYLSSKLNETPIRLRDLINTYIYLQARLKHLLSFPADQRLPSAFARAVPSSSSTGGGLSDQWHIGMSLGGSGNGNGNGAENGKGKAKAKDQDGLAGELWKEFVFDIPGFHDEVFWNWKDVIVSSEMQILKRLGFEMQVDLPYSHVINYLKILDLVFEPDIAQMCWSILNDMLLTPLYAIHPPHTLACASILLTTRLRRIALPRDWHILFDADFEDMWSCCGRVMHLWRDWGTHTTTTSDVIGEKPGAHSGEREDSVAILQRENRWRRAWILSDSRRAVRKWVEERERGPGL